MWKYVEGKILVKLSQYLKSRNLSVEAVGFTEFYTSDSDATADVVQGSNYPLTKWIFTLAELNIITILPHEDLRLGEVLNIFF